jgi:hypothetical protein
MRPPLGVLDGEEGVGWGGGAGAAVAGEVPGRRRLRFEGERKGDSGGKSKALDEGVLCVISFSFFSFTHNNTHACAGVAP